MLVESETLVAPYAKLIIRLLQGVIYEDEKQLWRELLSYRSQVHEYFGKIGVKLMIYEEEGLARIEQPHSDDDENENDERLPRLMRRIPLSYETTLLAVLLREMLEEFDIKSEGSNLFVTPKDIKERLELFFKERTNKSKLWKELSKPINDLLKIGILKLKREDEVNRDNSQYEVKRLIKVLISNDKLEEIKIKTDQYVDDSIQH
jgi:hypothetical protein